MTREERIAEVAAALEAAAGPLGGAGPVHLAEVAVQAWEDSARPRGMLAIGGRLGGQRVNTRLAPGQSHVDLLTGDTYVVRSAAIPDASPAGQALGVVPTRGWRAEVLVHSSAPNLAAAMQALAQHLLGEWIRAEGQEVDLPPHLARQATQARRHMNGK